MQKLKGLCKIRPTFFGTILSLLPGLGALIGFLVPEYIAIIIALTMIGLLLFKYDTRIRGIFKSSNLLAFSFRSIDDNCEDEFSLEVNENNAFVLEQACDADLTSMTPALGVLRRKSKNATHSKSNLSDNDDDSDKSEEIPPELLISGCIPELNENSDSSLEEDLIPKLQSVRETELISLGSNYANEDLSISLSSSDDDDSLSRRYTFQNYITGIRE